MLTRRELLEASIAAGAGLATGLGSGGCAAGDHTPLLATFEVTEHSALIAAHAANAAGGELALGRPGQAPLLRRSVTFAAERGGTAAIDVDGLQPDTEYEYTVTPDGGAPAAPFRFRTAPPPDAVVPVHFVFSADLDVDIEPDLGVVDAMRQARPAFFASLGDWPYTDLPDAQTLGEYRLRHFSGRAAPAVQQLLQEVPVFAIWDDHEVASNWDGQLTRDEPDRVAAAVQAWDEWFPLRRPPSGARYRSWRWGALAELFCLDVRSYRSGNLDDDDGGKTMLGPAQKEWFLGALQASPAPFKLVLSAVPLDFDRGVDAWRNFQRERDEIVGAIRDSGVGGVVFLTADQHWFAAHHHHSGLKEFQVGPIARGLRIPLGEHDEVVALVRAFNFGEIEIAADPAPTLRFCCRDAAGAELYREQLAAGRGALLIDDARGPRGFRTAGAHQFFGTTPAAFAYATPGDYQVTFADGRVRAGRLADGGSLRITADGEASPAALPALPRRSS